MINGIKLRIYEDDEDHKYYKLRGQENKEIDFIWPQIDYTISESDLMEPI
jgi:hypothetical protein